MDHLGFLFAAYAVVWLAIFLYLLSIDRRSRATEREVESLRRLVDERRDDSPGD